MEWKSINKEKRIETLSVIGLALLILHLYLTSKKPIEEQGAYLTKDYLIYVSAAFLVSGLFIKQIAHLITFLWLKLSEGMGFVMSKVLLGAVFYLFLFPFSLLYKLFNKDSLNIKAGKGSYFVERKHKYTQKDLENIW